MRLGINVPDDLIKRLEPLKPTTNISQICREAISKYVEASERASFKTKEDGMENVANNIAEKEKGIVIDWETLGLEDARLWSQKASISQWEKLFVRLDVFESQGRSPFENRFPIPHVEGTKQYYDRQHEYDTNDGWFIRQIEADESSNPYATAELEWYRGFLPYVMAVRRMVRQKIEADVKRQAEAWKSKKSELKNNIEFPSVLFE
jgi:hypothetical protein